jgi:transcriptional regulator with XRE-family HTH domain
MLSQKIRQLRQFKGISQVELGNALGVTKQCVSNWENDNIQPSIETLIKLAEYFEVTTDYLLGLQKAELLDVSGLPAEIVSHLRNFVADYKKIINQ